ncbi:MAG: hypothetical protein OXE92_08660 [Bacteroidetes bacterium]|nr:hypothetical protein [Bacteroidota bacterium]MCY4205779.1 hypothetical protein [Bacteroidota bacterium]
MQGLFWDRAPSERRNKALRPVSRALAQDLVRVNRGSDVHPLRNGSALLPDDVPKVHVSLGFPESRSSEVKARWH